MVLAGVVKSRQPQRERLHSWGNAKVKGPPAQINTWLLLPWLGLSRFGVSTLLFVSCNFIFILQRKRERETWISKELIFS